MKDELNRRDYLKSLGAVSITTSTAGCGAYGDIFTPEAPQLEGEVENTQTRIRNSLPWSDYGLIFDVDRLNLELDNIGPTGVEDAQQYDLGISIDLATESNDLDGWLGADSPNARREEFVYLYAAPTFDMLLQAYDDLQDWTVPNQPSHQNQIVQYTLEIGAEDCSYLADNIPGGEMTSILESPTAYLNYLTGDGEYLDDGGEVIINLDSSFLGIDYLC